MSKKKKKDFAKTHARNTDPKTSHKAAARAPSLAKQHCAKIYAIIKIFGPLTAEEISFCCNLTYAQVSRRTSDLQKTDQIEDSGKVHMTTADREAIAWRVT